MECCQNFAGLAEHGICKRFGELALLAGGSADYLQKQQTPLAFSQITGCAESILLASTNNGVGGVGAGRRGVPSLQSSSHPSPCLQAGQLLPSLDEPVEAPSFHEDTWQHGSPSDV